MSHVNIRIRDENELPADELQERKYQSLSDMQNQEQTTDVDLQRARWKNRRRMAWLSLITMIAVTFILLFAPIPEARIRVLSEPITWSYFALASVIGAYMGFTTWASRK